MDPFDLALADEPAAEPLPVAPQMPQPPQAQKPSWKSTAPLLALLPLAMKQGGQAGVAALLQGWQQGQLLKRQQGQQDWQNQRTSAMDAANLDYRNQMLKSQAETRQQAAELRKQQAKDIANQRMSAAIERFRALVPDVQTEDEARALIATGIEQGLPPELVTNTVMQTATPTRMERMRAKKALDEAFKLAKDAGVDGITFAKQMVWKDVVPGRNVTFDELVALTGAAPASGSVQMAPKPVDRRGFVQRDIEINGKRIGLTNYDPDTGKFTRIGTGEEVAIPPGALVTEYQEPRAASGGGGQDGGPRKLTPNAEAGLTTALRGQWTRFTKSILDRQQSIAKIDSGLAALGRGNRNAATQAIILAFNKLQDETSVVREGEYARSEDLAPILNRIEAAFVKLQSGGGALLDEDLRALAFEAKETARALEAVTSRAAEDMRVGMEDQLSAYGIPTSRVFGSSQIGKPKRESAPKPLSNIGRFTVREK